jgi:hypothetical protein
MVDLSRPRSTRGKTRVGFPRAGGRSLTVTFPPDMLDALTQIAAEEGVSVGEQIRTMLEWSLEEHYGEDRDPF